MKKIYFIFCIIMILFFMNHRMVIMISSSMEPVIPMYSLLIIEKNHHDYQPGEIMSYHANRFDYPIVLTHYFDHYEKDEYHHTVYKTRAYMQEDCDGYMIYSEDIIGKYIFHIAGIGKFILFLKSSYGLRWILEMIVVMGVTCWIEKKIS